MLECPSSDKTLSLLFVLQWLCLLSCRDDTRLEQLNRQWQVEDPAALVRNALIAAGMTATADNRVLGVTDANMASTRCVAIDEFGNSAYEQMQMLTT